MQRCCAFCVCPLHLVRLQRAILVSNSPSSSFKVVKNLLFIAKVLYLLELDSENKQERLKDSEEQDTLGDALAREAAEEKAAADGKTESSREEKEEPSKPATLMWLIQKLSRMAKLEAAYSPRNPLKVQSRTTESLCCLLVVV